MPKPTITSPAERLAAKTRRLDNGCLEFTGAKIPAGYGRIWDGAKPVYSHRLAWSLANGPIPPKTQIDHLCFNTSCCEPTHLRATNHSENQQHRRGPQANSTTGFRNVFLLRGKFEVKVQAGNEFFYGGRFDTPEEANVSAIALRALHHI
jgi:hypothetical protein